MIQYSKSIQKLIGLFSKLPTVGPRTASRFVFYLLNLPKEEIEFLTSAILEMKENVKLCEFCFLPFEGEEKLCEICQNPTRDKNLLCLIEKESDLISIEKTKQYAGLYFILGGTFAALKKNNHETLRIQELESRVKNPSDFFPGNSEFKEIIIATNSTTDGEATTLYLERTLKNFEVKITRLGRGLPVGGELEYADEETLKSAIEGRK